MNDIEIIDLWKSYSGKLDEVLQLNRKNAEEITRIKVKSFLSSMKPIKWFGIILGLFWVGFLDVAVISLFRVASLSFLIWGIGVSVLNTLAIGMYFYQLILIYKVGIDEPIIETQKKLAGLKTSSLWVPKLLMLQLPLWTIFYWNEKMLENAGVFGWTILILVTLIFTAAAIWLFLNIKFENREKKWFKIIFNGREWKPLMKAMDLLEQVKNFEGESRL